MINTLRIYSETIRNCNDFELYFVLYCGNGVIKSIYYKIFKSINGYFKNAKWRNTLEGIHGYDYADIYFHYRTWYIYVNVVSRLLD